MNVHLVGRSALLVRVDPRGAGVGVVAPARPSRTIDGGHRATAEWSRFASVEHRSATVEVAAGVAVRFHYLGENGSWFDDPDDLGTPDPGGDA
ncbi:hypothetical protein [Amycolatopsis sp. cmx-4-83]|uniref:hypothetical protein n=1 Tax=Amycolatopsis sp. cmx-4-83 TaxID=2790940 RepID=UPI00397910D6